MQIITTDAEMRLSEMVSSIQNTTSWRAIHLNFSKLDASYREGMRTQVLLNIIKDLLKDEKGQVFLCEDGDIFLVFLGVATKILDKVSLYMTDLFKESIEGSGIDGDAFCQVYDLSVEKDAFFAVCRQKLLSVKTEEVEKREKADEPVIQPTPQVTIDDEVVENVLKKREERPDTHILLVEDDLFSRRIVRNILKKDHTIIEAGNGQEALQSYALNAPNMVFLDIDLPDISGHVVLQKILEMDPNAFVVMLSGNSFKEYIIAAIEEGAKGFITKPFPKEKLLHYVHEVENSVH